MARRLARLYCMTTVRRATNRVRAARLPWLRPDRLSASPRLRDAGRTTAEYAIGTLAACGFAALLVTILRGSVVQGLLLGIIRKALALGG